MSAAQCVSCSKQEQITTLRGTGTGCTHLLALYELILFIHETNVMPSSGKEKLKGICSHTWFLQVVSAAQCVSCSKQEQINTLRTFGWYRLHTSSGIILIDCVHETHVMPSSGKVKGKRYLLSYLVLAGRECCPMCQLLQTGTNYHITYFWLLQVAPILWYYIDWWCLFMKPMWCHLVGK